MVFTSHDGARPGGRWWWWSARRSSMGAERVRRTSRTRSASERIERGPRSAKRYVRDARRGDAMGDDEEAARARMWGVLTGRMDDDETEGGGHVSELGRVVDGLQYRWSRASRGVDARGCETAERGASACPQITAAAPRCMRRSTRARRQTVRLRSRWTRMSRGWREVGCVMPHLSMSASTSTARTGGGRRRRRRVRARDVPRLDLALEPRRRMRAGVDGRTASHVTPNQRARDEEDVDETSRSREALRQSARVGDLLLKREGRVDLLQPSLISSKRIHSRARGRWHRPASTGGKSSRVHVVAQKRHSGSRGCLNMHARGRALSVRCRETKCDVQLLARLTHTRYT